MLSPYNSSAELKPKIEAAKAKGIIKTNSMKSHENIFIHHGRSWRRLVEVALKSWSRAVAWLDIGGGLEVLIKEEIWDW